MSMLDQSEIDALLNTVTDEGEASGDHSDAAAGAMPDDIAFVDDEAPLYDFRRPERVSKDQMRALASIHEVFARNFGATLSGQLRTIVDVRVVSVEQVTYIEIIHSLPNPTVFMVLKAPPLEGQMCLEMSPLIIYPIIDRMLGGASNSTYIPQRGLTAIEWRLICRIVERALDNLSEVWQNLANVKFELTATESNPQLVHIVAPSEVVVFITFEIKLGQSAGTMCLCVPFNTIEGVLSHLTSQSWFYRPKPATEQQTGRITRNLARSKLELTAYLAQTRVRLNDLRNLEPGDILPLDKRHTDDVIIQIAGHNKYAGKIGVLRGQRAIGLTRVAESDEPL
ncbi:MAG: flagellar motor switch protein FliM [Phycisphaerales bacterium]|nr:flagellar motor switch protein FliM [Phycisphaerales bacterium]